MQTLSRLRFRHRGRARAVAAWLAIAALIGALPAPAPARASCAAGAAAAVAKACSHCRHVAHPAVSATSHARCALARTPCCGCALSADREPSAAASAFQLEPPAPEAQALPAAHAAAHGDALPPAARFLAASGPPGAPPDGVALGTILRL